MIYIITAMVLVLLAVCMFFARAAEKRDYNDGICPVCGEELRHFDNDSQGGRGYCCDSCNYHTWVSYNVDNKRGE
jgi:predicted amidophosphoribosyltransferase